MVADIEVMVLDVMMLVAFIFQMKIEPTQVFWLAVITLVPEYTLMLCLVTNLGWNRGKEIGGFENRGKKMEEDKASSLVFVWNESTKKIIWPWLETGRKWKARKFWMEKLWFFFPFYFFMRFFYFLYFLECQLHP